MGIFWVYIPLRRYKSIFTEYFDTLFFSCDGYNKPLGKASPVFKMNEPNNQLVIKKRKVKYKTIEPL